MNPTTFAHPKPKPGVVPFAVAITVLNVLGHTWLGFEQAWLTPFVAVGAAYFSEIATELAINGWKRARFRGGARHLAIFLLPAHITGLAVGMLLYTNHAFHESIELRHCRNSAAVLEMGGRCSAVPVY